LLELLNKQQLNNCSWKVGRMGKLVAEKL